MIRPLPTRLKVLGRTFKVRGREHLKVSPHSTIPNVYDEAKDNWVHEPDGIDALGLTDVDAQVIEIETLVGLDIQKDTLLHEALHAMLATAGMRDAIDSEVEERVVKRLSPILRLFLKENPHVYTYLTGRNVW